MQEPSQIHHYFSRASSRTTITFWTLPVFWSVDIPVKLGFILWLRRPGWPYAISLAITDCVISLRWETETDPRQTYLHGHCPPSVFYCMSLYISAFPWISLYVLVFLCIWNTVFPCISLYFLVFLCISLHISWKTNALVNVFWCMSWMWITRPLKIFSLLFPILELKLES